MSVWEKPNNNTNTNKLYAATYNQLQKLLQLNQTFSRDIKMVFGIEKFKTFILQRGN